MTDFIGEFAALGTALLFSFGSTLFTLSGRQIGSPLVNRARLLMAMVFILVIHTLSFGQPLPLDAAAENWFWLGLSGFVGLALGDAFLFQAFVMIGPRLSMLVMALAPVLSVILAWLFLGEVLSAQELAGIALTVGGVAFVVSERQTKANNRSPNLDNPRHYIIGLLFALGGAIGQAGGQVLAKPGLDNDFPAFSGLLIRISVALIAVWSVTAVQGKLVMSYRKLRQNPRAVGMLTVAAFTGPVLGVWLSLVAVQRTSVGIASALIALTPVFLIPISYVVFGEKATRQAVVGTGIAFLGTVLLFI